MGFPTGERYKGTPAQDEKLEKQFLRKSEFMYKHKVPIWNGEFGPVYSSSGADAGEVNQERFNLLGQQLRIYDKYKVSWSIWLYKDIGVQGIFAELISFDADTKPACRDGVHFTGKPVDQDPEAFLG